MGAMGWRDAVTGASHCTYGVPRHVMAWDAVMMCGMVRHGKERHKMARYRLAWHGIVSHAMVWRDTAWPGMEC